MKAQPSINADESPQHIADGSVARYGDNTASPIRNLTSGRLLARNTAWNLAGSGVSLLLAIACFPVLKRALGTDRLGVVTLAWAVVGYFGLFDFGLARALTKLVAERIAQHRDCEVATLIWTAAGAMAMLGCLGAAIIWALSPWLIYGVFKVPTGIQAETLSSFKWLSASIPIVILTSAFRGVLEALQEFKLATAIRVPMTSFTYLGPIAVLPFSRSLVPIIVVLVAGRFVACVAHLVACFHVVPGLRRTWSISVAQLRPLWRFGTWMTVSNVVGPLMVTIDRFVIAALVSVTAVAFYATPYEIVTKLWLVPASIVAVLFPAFSSTMAADRSRAALLFERSTKYLFLILFPVALLLVAFAHEGLQLWLGPDFAANSAAVVRWLAVAVFINCFAHVPFAHLQSAGRPDLTAKLHLCEVPAYLVVLWILVHRAGIVGAAAAWFLRVLIDTAVLFWFSQRVLPENASTNRRLGLGLALASAVFLLATLSVSVPVKLGFVVLVLAALGVVGWSAVLSPDERLLVITKWRTPHVVS